MVSIMSRWDVAGCVTVWNRVPCCESWRFGTCYLLPAAVDIPAPVMTTIRRARPDRMSSATALRLRSERVSGGVSLSTTEFSWPILRHLARSERRPFGLSCRRCRRPMVAAWKLWLSGVGVCSSTASRTWVGYGFFLVRSCQWLFAGGSPRLQTSSRGGCVSL